MIEGNSRDLTEKMVVIGKEHRDNAEVDIRENMDNSQSGDELVPRTEQNNDETEVRYLVIYITLYVICITFIIYLDFHVCAARYL